LPYSWPGANGLRIMIPTEGPAGALSGVTRNGAVAAYTTQVVKGVSYAFVDGVSGTYQSTYASGPVTLAPTADAGPDESRLK